MVMIHVWLSSCHEALTDVVHHHALHSHLYEGDGQLAALHYIMLVHIAHLSGRGYGDGYIHWCHVFHIKCLYMQNDYTFNQPIWQLVTKVTNAHLQTKKSS
jgi:hypothetical protein